MKYIPMSHNLSEIKNMTKKYIAFEKDKVQGDWFPSDKQEFDKLNIVNWDIEKVERKKKFIDGLIIGIFIGTGVAVIFNFI